MYGNAFEAFIGAIYLDQGYERCKLFLEEKIIHPYIDLDKLSRKEVNFKSKLIEWSQKNKMEVSFELIEQFSTKRAILYSRQKYVLRVYLPEPEPVILKKSPNKMLHKWR